MDQQRRGDPDQASPRRAMDSREEQHERDELAARRERQRQRQEPLTRREREERWPIG